MLTEQLTDAAGIVLAVQALIAVGVYAWTALALMAVFRKAGRAPWKAWVPVLNAWTLFELGAMRGWWAVVTAVGAVVVGGASTVLAGLLTASAVTASFGGDAAGARSTAMAALLVPAALWLVLLAGVLVLHVRVLIGVGRGFGLSAGYVVLGVLLFPVWASVVGWGSPRWLRAGHAASAAAPGASAPLPPVIPALSDFSTRPPAAQSPFLGGSAAPAHPAPSDGSPFGDPIPATPPAAAAWAPPQVAPLPPPEAAPVSAAADDEHTVLGARRPSGWSLLLPDGAVVRLTGDAAVLGRNPVAPARAPGAQVIAVDDATRTVSKTHALLTRAGSGWIVTDLDSTNGISVGVRPEVGGGDVVGSAAVDGSFFLGDAPLTLRADR